MKLRVIFATLAVGLSLSLGATPSHAQANSSAESFVQEQHAKIATLLKQPATGARDAQLTGALGSFVDYDELTRRAFGEPCPPAIASCTNHWKELNEAQQNEVRGLLRQLVEKNYKKNLVKTLDYEVSYKGQKAAALGDAKIRTEAKSKLKPRDPAVQVDYLVKGGPGNFKVVDIVTEGSSLTKNYYDQFHKMMTTPGQGYPHVVKKLQDKIAKKE